MLRRVSPHNSNRFANPARPGNSIVGQSALPAGEIRTQRVEISQNQKRGLKFPIFMIRYWYSQQHTTSLLVVLIVPGLSELVFCIFRKKVGQHLEKRMRNSGYLEKWCTLASRRASNSARVSSYDCLDFSFMMNDDG